MPPPPSSTQKPNPSLLRKTLVEIARGWSAVKWGKTIVYIKHLTQLDQIEVDDYYEMQLTKARKDGIPSEENKRKWLSKKGLWKASDERDLVMHKDYVANLELTKTKAFLKSQIAAQEKILVEERATLAKMIAKKDLLFGLTDEKYASQKMQFYYIHLSFFKDSALTKRMFTMKETDQLDEEESYELLGLYIDFINHFDVNIIRKLSVSPVFANSFYLCGEDLSRFFGKPIIDLTFYQSNLLSYGLYFKSVFSQEKVPDSIRDDPDQIEEYINRSKNAKTALKTSLEGGATGIPGATSEDFAALNLVEDKEGHHMRKKE